MNGFAPLKELRTNRSQYDIGRKRSGVSGKSTVNGKAYNNMKRPILAIDGEGVTDRKKRHHYILLAASDGSYIHAESLSTVDVFSYLLGLPRNHLTVGFSLNYDICKWLRDVPREVLSVLWKNGNVFWAGYAIRWATGKYFDLKKGRQSIRIYDVFGFFQHSFVASLEEWKVATPEQIERIRTMKASRSSFSSEEFDEILAYCLEECELLVKLVDKLRKALLDIDLTLNQWHGAGAIATAIFQKEGVKRYLGRPDKNGKPMGPPPEHSRAVLGAYYGGRFELAQSGQHDNVWSYDIRSAYPFIASGLPCLSHVVYRRHKNYKRCEWAIYLVEWEIGSDHLWPPFPFRVEQNRQILYPISGRGYYHSSELHAAQRLYGNQIRVVETLEIECHCDHQPFAFVSDYFAYRDRLKREGHQGQLTIKLGLNSLYGKMAQGVGWGEHRPPYQSYLWAGMVTAGTRAMLLDAIAQNPDAIIATATDGIVSSCELKLSIGAALGCWEVGKYVSFFSVQSGVYETWEGVPFLPQTKSRGFGKAETSFDAIRKVHTESPIDGTFSYKTTRFIGLGAALMRTDFWKYFGQWVDMDRVINFSQSKRFYEAEVDGVVTWSPPDRPTVQEESAPYQPRSNWSDLWGSNQDVDSFELLVDSYQP